MKICTECGVALGESHQPSCGKRVVECPEVVADDCEIPKCAWCHEPLENGEEIRSTPQGSMHDICAHLHEEANPGEW